MTFFTNSEYNTYYGVSVTLSQAQIDMASEMIYGQVGKRYQDSTWDKDSVPTAIKNASMEQMRFILEYDIPVIDYKGKVKAGEMESELSSNISTLAYTILANNGYIYRGSPINYNMSLEIPF